MELYSVNAGYFKLDGGAMFGVVPKSMWEKLNPADENNMCSWATRCLLVKENDRLILIDTGMGNKQSEKFFGYYYLHGEDTLEKSLAANGFHANDITDVILTHLHFDHCGGAIRREGDTLIPAFPNATYWSTRKHWDWAIQPNDREKASFLKENIEPLASSGKLKFIEPLSDVENNSVLQETPFTENISILFTHGHTESMMLPKIRYKGRTIVFMADLLPSVGHLPIPYIMAYDMFPYTTLQEKKLFLEQALAENYILFFEHDPLIECCDLQKLGIAIRSKDTFRIDQL